MLGWHFTSDKLRDGRPIPPIGEWLVHEGPIEPCVSGLHMCEQPFDALKYAPGNILHRVELEGDLVSHGEPIDKWVGRKRRILASVDMTEKLRWFARQEALSVIHLWNAPDIVKQYLETGDESIRATARAAAWDASWAAARAAAMDAAWAAAWAAARNDAMATARAAAWAAAWAAARDDAMDAAWAAARAAARDDAWGRFSELVYKEFNTTTHEAKQ